MIRFVTALLLMFGLLAAPAHATPSNCITVFYQLFGPQPGTGNGYTYTPTTEWKTLTATSANSKGFVFDYASPTIVNAVWKTMWYPYGDSVQARLVSKTSTAAGGVETELAVLDPPTASGPIISQADITTQMQALAAAGQSINATQFFKGNGTDQMILYESHIRVVYCLEP